MRALTTLTMAAIVAGAIGRGQPETEADFYVSPSGSDAWSGSRAEPAADGTDGPFATIGKAQQALADRLAAERGTTPVRVLVREGTYRIATPLVFTPAHGGTTAAPVEIAGYPGERPVIDGGVPVTNWVVGADGVWTADLPEVRNGSRDHAQLWIDGQRRPRCRKPDTGTFRTAGPIEPLRDREAARRDAAAKQGFRYRPEDLGDAADWEEMNIVLYHSWTASIHWVRELDAEGRILRFTAPSGWPVGWWENEQRYHIENLRSALDRPGEWYLSRAEGRLYYIPLPGEAPDAVRAVLAVAPQLLRVAGDAAAGLYAENIHFLNLSFRHSGWRLPRDRAHDGQAGVSLGAAVTVSDAVGCRFEDIDIGHVGEYGLWFAKGSRDCALVRSELHDLGAGGVKIGETVSEENPETACRGNMVDNCFIHDGGRICPAGIGVWIGRSSYNTVSHNEISDFYYSGVSVGWSWGYAPSSANHNVIEYNRIHHLGGGVLSDMGGIYCLGISPGTVLRGNIMHDINAYSYGGWGLYTDEGSTGILMEKNVVYDTKSGGFHQHYGENNTVRNNILAFAREGQIIRSREEEHLSFTVEKNIVIFDNGQPLGKNYSNGNFRFADNLYWDVRETEFDFAGYDFDEWRKETGQDAGSLIADPLFVDAAARDFRLRPESPALRLGIEPLDDVLATAGLYGDDAWTAKPAGASHIGVDPEMRPPEAAPAGRLRSLQDGFEETAPGALPARASVSGETGGASIRVTDEAAASGTHSLKFTDAPDLPHVWQPHMVYRFNRRKGVLRGAFRVFLKPGARFWHEWRDDRTPYQVGPSLRFREDGQVEAMDGGNMKVLGSYPTETWIGVSIRCPLGSEAGAYDLTLTVPGQEPLAFQGLGTGKAEWQRTDWVGFVSEADDTAVFYIDDVDFAGE